MTMSCTTRTPCKDITEVQTSRTDKHSINVNQILAYDVDFQSPVSYGHSADINVLKVIWYTRRSRDERQTDGHDRSHYVAR